MLLFYFEKPLPLLQLYSFLRDFIHYHISLKIKDIKDIKDKIIISFAIGVPKKSRKAVKISSVIISIPHLKY